MAESTALQRALTEETEVVSSPNNSKASAQTAMNKQDDDDFEHSEASAIHQTNFNIPKMQPMELKNAKSPILKIPLQTSISTPLTSPAQRSFDDNDITLHAQNLSPSPKQKQKDSKLHSHSAIYQNHPQCKSDDDIFENNIDFLRIWIQRQTQHRESDEVRGVCRKLQTACMLRQRWVYQDKNGHFPACMVRDQDICLNLNIVKNALPKKSNHCFEQIDGVFQVYKLTKRKKKSTTPQKQNDDEISDDEQKEIDKYEYIKSNKPQFDVHSFEDFMNDLRCLMELTGNGPARTFCYQRLQTLQAKFKLHMLLNEENEMSESKRVPHRDFYNIRKVDNHIHHSACMTQKHLLRFIKHKLKTKGDVIVHKSGDKCYSLKQLFKELNLSAYDLSIDTLSMHGHRDTFFRFDRFNNKYNPIGQSSLRQVFLKVDNHTKGRFLAEITKEVFDDLKESKYQYSELRVSIYGKSNNEWDILSDWICDHNLHSTNSRWMIQIPRLYSIYKAKGIINNFGEMLDNIFRALFEVTIDPLSHPKLHLFLTLVVGFDSVDDESIRENVTYNQKYPKPSDWDIAANPPYIVWSYYIYANLLILNRLRESRGMNAFAYRPHAGEAGDADHVAAAFLLAQSINHGITLKKYPVLQYLYYLKQVGLSMSPLSNNLLFLEYEKNPFNIFFQRGLNVTLSTDDPLMIHYTKDPLIEEYAIAAQVYKLSAIDMCEIARNSVLQSGFNSLDKKHWLGANFNRRGVAGNNVKQTNVPSIRLLFRDELLAEEENWILGLPPPIFPSIKLNLNHHHLNTAKKHHHHKKDKTNNFLVDYRRTVPFNLSGSSKAKIVSSNSSSSQNSEGSVKYDDMGYVNWRRSKEEKRKKLKDRRYYFKYDDKKILHEQEENKDGGDKFEIMKKQFMLVAIGLAIGYFVASMSKSSKKNDASK